MKSRVSASAWSIAVLLVAGLTPACHAQSSGRVVIRVGASGGTIRIQTTGSVPDGGTATLGGVSQASESRTELGTPGAGAVPYLGRTSRNVASGRSVSSTRVIGSARIIDLREEEFRQTGYRRR